MVSEVKHNYIELQISGVEEGITLLRKLWNEGYYFRGHANEEFGLSTSLERFCPGNKKAGEEFLIREFTRRLHHYLRSEDMPGTTFELMSIMQHYGAPTRLLDLSRSPYVALYFAVRDILKPGNSAVWAVLPYRLNTLSLTVLLSEPSDVFRKDLEKLNELQLLEKFTEEKYFMEAFISGNYDIIMTLEPQKMNVRLNIQQGLFMISGKTEAPFADVLTKLLNEFPAEKANEKFPGPALVKCIIPQELKKSLLVELESMNINAATLFGGIEGFAISLKEILPTIFNTTPAKNL